MVKNNVIERPLDLLNQSKGKKVLVFLKGDKTISGTLVTFDIHINLVMDNTELIENILITPEYSKKNKKLGLIFVRGDVISYISPSSGEK